MDEKMHVIWKVEIAKFTITVFDVFDLVRDH